ncbi:MAG TPA: GDSL-type esterase/lipase family protein [Myxococcota bacterium]|nr:GDSL-type esterase/lipase family protein [Myxococcota bacterium]
MRRLLLVALALALALGSNELLLRLFWSNPFARETPELVLSLRTQHGGSDREVDRSALHLEPARVRFRTDARGYIEPTRRVADPEFTLAFQGGSTTECLVVQEELRWPNQVAVQLEPLGFRVNALNAGLSGNTAHDSLVNLIELVSIDKPDVVLLMNAINDAGLLAEGGYALREPKPDGWRAGSRWLLQSLSAHSSLVGLVRRVATFGPQEIHRSADAVATLPSTPDSAPYGARVRAWVRSARAFGMEPVLITEPLSTLRNELTPPWTDAGALARFNDLVRQIGREEGVTVVDLAEALQHEPAFATPEKIYYDGMHVNDAGAQLYGHLVAQALARDVLPRLRAARASHLAQIAR